MESYELFIQSLALVALGFSGLSYHQKTRKRILFLSLLGLCAWIAHFTLLGATTGAMLTILNAFFTALFIFRKELAWVGTRTFLIVALFTLSTATLLSWENMYSLFVLGGTATVIFGKWQTNLALIRKMALLSSLLWLAYDFSVNSYGGALADSIIIGSIVISLLIYPHCTRNCK